ncbi:MAG: ribokinase [Chloroflexi bacterium]|nr:ribokinase [Chloroflexota bacterium]
MEHPKEPLICIVGSINMDLVVRTPALPVPGQTVLGGPFATFPGGKGANQAVAAVRAGGQVAMVGCIGEDAYGPMLHAGLLDEGIDVSLVRTQAGSATGVALIAVNPRGQNTIIVAPGANAALTLKDLERSSEVIRSAAVLLLQLEVPLPVVAAAAQMARRAGTPVILNPAPAPPVNDSLLDLLALVDVLVPNETEAATLTAYQRGDSTDPELMARALHELGAGAVVITLGEGGVFVLDGDRTYRQAPFSVRAVDATAAGDAFTGALALALAENRTLQEAVRWGAAAGALAAATAGAQPSLPSRASIQKLLVRAGA